MILESDCLKENKRQAVCSLSDVSKRYGRRGPFIIENLSVTIHEGEVLGVRGNNGAGKSTLLEMMAGILSPDSGQIQYKKEIKKRIGYVPQELSLYEGLTAKENLRFWGIAQGLPAKIISVRSRWLLEKLQLADRAAHRVDTLSGGMKRRLHLASALMLTPKLLLLDEPTVGADAESVESILQLLEQLKAQGCAIVVVSHIEQELHRICDRTLVLTNGMLQEPAI